MVVLVDAKYFGGLLRNARRNQSVRANDVTRMLKISLKELHRYEHGKEPIPEIYYSRCFIMGFV